MSKSSVQLVFRRSPSSVSVLNPHAPTTTPANTPQPGTPASPQKPTTENPVDHSDKENQQLREQLDYLQNLLNEVGGSIEDLQQQHRDTTLEMQETIVELAVVAASWLTRVAIDADEFAVDDLVQEMMTRLRDEHPVRIFLHEDDANLLNGLKESSADTPKFSEAEVEFIPDNSLQRGVVRAQSERTTLMTDLDGRLADIRQVWMEKLNETQTERRADESTGGKLRRFPDRRHSA